MVHEASLFLSPANGRVIEASGWRTDGTPHMGKRSPYCDVQFPILATGRAQSPRRPQPPGRPSRLHGGEQIVSRLVVETVRRPVGVRVERTHNRSAACIQPRHEGSFGAGITAPNY